MIPSYVSCHWIQHGINFEPDNIQMCCLCCHEGGGNIIVKKGFDGRNSNWDEIFDLKKQFIVDNQNNIYDPKCKGCFNLTEKQWDDTEQYINYLHFNHWTNCNCNCVYCYTSWDKENFNKRPHYNVVPILKELFSRKQFRPGGEVTFAGGEPTILTEFDDIISLCLENGADRITIHSSGIKYSQALEQGIKEKKVSICLSADAGTSKTYKKIKRVDKFKEFWKNTAKYAKMQTDENDKKYVTTKFIVIPEMNMTKKEVDKFFELSKDAGIKTVTLDIETQYCWALRDNNKPYPKELIEFCKYILERAKELEFDTIFYNNFNYLVYSDEFKEHNS